jgi:hypothetical protein
MDENGQQKWHVHVTDKDSVRRIPGFPGDLAHPLRIGQKEELCIKGAIDWLVQTGDRNRYRSI